MKRQFGMLFGIICILIIGISVTVMTRSFVASKGVETSSILMTADLMAADSVAEEVAPAAVPAAAVAMQMETAPVAITEETAAAYSVRTAAASRDFAAEEAAPGPRSPLDPAPVESPEKGEAVKSPLDPMVEEKAVSKDTMLEDTEWMVDDFFARFEQTEGMASKLWDNVTTENPVAYHAAAEQERLLWDYELNLVYGEIRENMSEKEAEELKHLEIEWIKERDQYAERIAAKSPVMNGQNQNPAYTRALAEKTKERCYWLVSEYETVLNQE